MFRAGVVDADQESFAARHIERVESKSGKFLLRLSMCNWSENESLCQIGGVASQRYSIKGITWKMKCVNTDVPRCQDEE